MRAAFTRRALVGALPAAGMAMTATPSRASGSDAELARLLHELEHLARIAGERETDLGRACDAWDAENSIASLDTPEGMANYNAAVQPFQDIADRAWEERDAIAERIRMLPADTPTGLVAKARAMRLDLCDVEEGSWSEELLNGFIAEIERMAEARHV